LTVRLGTDILGSVSSDPTAALRAARVERGWSQTDAARELVQLGRRRGVPVAAAASLKTLLSRWENGHVVPEPQYRSLLAELFGRTAGELGLDPEARVARPTDGPQRLRAALDEAAAADAAAVALWREQLAAVSKLDDQLGAAGAGGLVRAQVTQLAHTLEHTLEPAARAAVGAVLTAAAALAGAQALDTGEPERAWEAYRRAQSAADVAHQPVAFFTALAGLARVLVEIGQPDRALTLLGVDPPEAPAVATGRWAAAVGLAMAAGGRAHAAAAAFGQAERATRQAGRSPAAVDLCWPSTADVEFLDLHRHKGHALTVLGDPAAAVPLAGALAGKPASTRHRAELHADLAAALAEHDPPAAAGHARRAMELAARIGSRRIPARLAVDQ
jgi:transcriptional regulator with XRE-family HTH domain